METKNTRPGGHGISRRRVMTMGGLAAAGVTALGQLPHAEAAPARTVRVSQAYGHPVDATSAIQAALDSDVDTVVIDNDADGGVATWNTGPLHVRRDGMRVVLEPGVHLQALPGAFPGNNDCLISVIDRADVTIQGHGATMAMNKAEYTTGEWRMGLTILGSRNITVEGISIADTGGDGIYVGVSKTKPDGEDHCRNIVIRDVECVRALRNGLSVISVDGLLVENSLFWQSGGKSPQGGVDLEPNHPTNVLKRIRFRDCRIDHNGTYGLIVALRRLDASSRKVDITFERVTVGTTGSQIPNLVLYGPSKGQDPGGRVVVRDSLIRKASISGAVGIYEKSARGLRFHMENTVIWDLANTFRRWKPITISPVRPSESVASMPMAYGGVWMHDCHLITDVAGPVLTTDREPETGTRMAQVHGSLWVSHRDDESQITTDFGAGPERCNLALLSTGGLAAPVVTIAVDRSSVLAGGEVLLTVRRHTGDLRAPLAVSYGTGSGTAQARLDLSQTSGSAVIPAGSSEVVVPLRTRAGLPGTRRAVVALSGGRGYQTQPSTREVSFTITTPA